MADQRWRANTGLNLSDGRRVEAGEEFYWPDLPGWLVDQGLVTEVGEETVPRKQTAKYTAKKATKRTGGS